MLALDAKAVLSGWQPRSHQLKVAGLAEFAAGAVPLERMVLDLRQQASGPDLSALTGMPWAGFLIDHGGHAPAGRPWLSLQGDPRTMRAGDVVELQPLTSKVAVRYRRGGNGNVLFATERCNSYCLMCSQPPRAIEDDWRLMQLFELVELIDREEASLAISGGEPTLMGEGLPHLIGHCAQQLPKTNLHVLSNGRTFADARYAERFRVLHPALSWGIPLYGDHFALHDYVVQRAGAFAETLRGLYALEGSGQRIEIRVVLVRPTVERLVDLARFICRNLPFVEHVALMGIEPIGFAKANHKTLWIDPIDMAAALTEAVEYLADRGIPVSIYNLPLCTLPEAIWSYAQRSISDWKQDYLPACAGCAVKDRCGGFFSWVNQDWQSRAIVPIMQIEGAE
ncbi:His-Xaa-Ser system radical SAM maturase HxsC [Lysobacter sp. S4-A87]|uniref:His-Xaa-Ser system radical SAM maturase HxsC n=1 Tax=Lysobacter sp. S4-A87 TaxID=2925843 RepID=UPI001F52F407|nr:His-Xaa-Ser system radical SAM maturase HxsC [Lysobacter sp. S4-A87]UNK49899.1 His-Xaa-Ser system radical SAM maturase HxsC [Lysobacter sp. S4-A87]